MRVTFNFARKEIQPNSGSHVEGFSTANVPQLQAGGRDKRLQTSESMDLDDFFGNEARNFAKYVCIMYIQGAVF